MSLTVVRSLEKRFGAIRNQGARPTCIAFAISDVHAVARGPFEALSAEHLYFHAVGRTPGEDPNVGVDLPTILDALAEDGQATEVGWPYLDPFSGYIPGTHPPSTATPVFRRNHDLANSTIEAVVAELDHDRPVVLALLITEAFCNAAGGLVYATNPGPDVDYHAVIAAGHGQLGSRRMLLVRNSWGPDWGSGGYCWVEADYVKPRLVAIAVMGATIG